MTHDKTMTPTDNPVEPKLVQVGRWLVPEDDPMIDAIIAMEQSVSELLDRMVVEVENNGANKNAGHHP